MSPTRKLPSPIQRQVEAYQEAWMQDHQAALACRDVEDTTAVGISVFQLLAQREDSWRDRVFRGVEEFFEEENQFVLSLFRDWLAITEEVLAGLPPFEGQFGSIERADKLRGCAAEARKMLEEWVPPRISGAVGLREMTLTPEAAAELDRILEEAKRLPPEPPRPRMQEISTDELRR
ncbi:MAG: hypothetical protein HYS12_01175 [Planctomycetes bacterium]|nr:hypothetical protein [Planctomycetota bacterium]